LRAPSSSSALGFASTTLSCLSRIRIASVVCSNSSASTPSVRVAAETVSMGRAAIACSMAGLVNLNLRVGGLIVRGPAASHEAPATAVADLASSLRQDKRAGRCGADEHATHVGHG